MLVLTRKIGEKIVIADDIVVEVVRIDGGKVRLGVTAPRERIIRRAELPNLDRRSQAYSAVLAADPVGAVAVAGQVG